MNSATNDSTTTDFASIDDMRRAITTASAELTALADQHRQEMRRLVARKHCGECGARIRWTDNEFRTLSVCRCVYRQLQSVAPEVDDNTLAFGNLAGIHVVVER